MKKGLKCPVCGVADVPHEDQWWMDNTTFQCPNCFSQIELSGLQRFRLYGWDSIVGWGIGISILTAGLALVITVPAYILFKLAFAKTKQFRVTRRNGVD